VPKLCNRKLQRYNKAEIHQLKGIFEWKNFAETENCDT
jgi:hypothetical protein